MANSLINDIVSNFDKYYKNDKVWIFDMFEDGSITSSEKEEIFKGLSVKNRAKLYNLMTSESRMNFYDYLIANDKKMADRLKERLRSYGVDNGLLNELDLLDNGYCTRDWSIEQIRDMYNFTGKGDYSSTTSSAHQYTPFGDYEYTVSVTEKGKVSVNIKTVAGHHMMAVKDFPEYMADGKTIQFLEVDEHLDAHGGFNPNATLAFYDGENYIGIKYNDPYINEFGEYVAGEFVGDDKMYKFVAETGSG